MEKLTKRKIETLKSFLTEEEAKEIIPLVKKYYGNYDASVTLTEDAPASSILYWGIHWTETPQGHEYWHDIRQKIIERELESQKNN